ncbi:fimbrial protein [Pseudomonas cedrina]|uniref:fimbrial protein n=1 Tax=Pseudomonas cedrina TaxID=651740 RepID=UPI00278B88B9|nr:fimbrial protein [Pseudomonas cedrina]MDQ0651168.1 type 1 fimbria pilin [Pseudomonas cedrina]
MKYSTQLLSALLVCGLSMTAQAACDRYPKAGHTLSLPATIEVPDSLPVGSLILRKAFDGITPGFTITCPTATLRQFSGHWSDRITVPGTGIVAYRTYVPGVAVNVMVKDSSGLVYPHSLRSASIVMAPGTTAYNNVSAEAFFYKIGPVESATLHATNWLYERWATNQGYFSLTLVTSTRFVKASATCDLAAGDVNRTVALPTVRVGDFRTANSAGATPFDLSANCSNASNVTFRFSGTAASGDAARFANTGSARGLGLWLYARGNNSTITPSGTTSSRTITVSNNRAVLPLGAAYFKTGTVGQGTFASTATVSITYN